MGNCDEQHLEYWCIMHVQEAGARCAKMESNNVTILDLAPSSLIGTSRSFRLSSLSAPFPLSSLLAINSTPQLFVQLTVVSVFIK